MIFEDIEEIRKVLQQNKSENDLAIARKHQNYLKLYTEDLGKDLILEVVKARLTPSAYAIFEREYVNPCISIYEHISKHLAKVYDAHGQVFNIDFGKSDTVDTRFRALRKTLYGVPDTVFWRNDGHEIVIKEPNSVFISGEKDGEKEIEHYPLHQIKAVKTTKTGIKYIILQNEEEKEYYVWDELNYWTIKQDFSSFDTMPHGAKKCPAVFASSDYMYRGNYTIRKSILSDKVTDGSLRDYLINKNTMAYYKAKSAFDIKVRPEHEDELLKRELWQKQAHDPNHEMSHEQMIGMIKGLRDNDPDMMGGIIKIDKAKMLNADFVGGIVNAIQNIAANIDSLRYHDEYLAAEKQNIIDSVIGNDIGQAIQNRAVNEEQVGANVEGKEIVLKEFGANIESVWNFSINRIGEMLTKLDFTLNFKLGERYFLKTEETLLNELEKLYKGTSNYAAIEQKQKEVFLTKNRHNPKAIERYELIKLLQPLAALPHSYVSQHRGNLNPDVVTTYENFPQILAIFEVQFGRIEGFAPDADTLSEKYQAIKLEFDKIEKQLYGTTNTTNTEANANNGQEESRN